MRTVDLRTEAIAEAGRLARARTLLRDGDRRALMDLASDAAWIALTRRPTRRRAVLLWRAALEDQSGRIVESLVVPVVWVQPFATRWQMKVLRWWWAITVWPMLPYD